MSSIDMRVCPKCNSFYSGPSATFCLRDGMPLNDVIPDTADWARGAERTQQQQHRVQKERRRLRWRRAVVVTVVAMILTRIVYVVAVKGVESQPQTPPVTVPVEISVQASIGVGSPTPTPIPSPAPSPSPSPTPTAVPTPTARPTATPRETPTPTVTPTPTPRETQRPTPTATATPTPTPKETATPTPLVLYTISGRVTSATGRAAQVRIRLSGPKKETAATDGEGRYRFEKLPAGDYVVAPTADRLNFEPRSRSFVKLSRNESANFIAIERPPDELYTISGRVTSGHGGAAQVRIRLVGIRSATTMTDAAGNYIFAGLPTGEYVVTPSADGMSFEPRSRFFIRLSRNESANFIAVARRNPDRGKNEEAPRESPKPSPRRRWPIPNWPQ